MPTKKKKRSIGLRARYPLITGGKVIAMVEVPAGTLVKRAYDPEHGEVRVQKEGGRVQKAAFLPYPANYGFIPGTLWPKEEGGDGDPLDVFILCTALEPGTVVEVSLLGAITLYDGARNDKLVALPVDRKLRPFNASSLKKMPKGALGILVRWMKHHDPADDVKLLGMKGPKKALALVKKFALVNEKV